MSSKKPDFLYTEIKIKRPLSSGPINFVSKNKVFIREKEIELYVPKVRLLENKSYVSKIIFFDLTPEEFEDESNHFAQLHDKSESELATKYDLVKVDTEFKNGFRIKDIFNSIYYHVLKETKGNIEKLSHVSVDYLSLKFNYKKKIFIPVVEFKYI